VRARARARACVHARGREDTNQERRIRLTKVRVKLG